MDNLTHTLVAVTLGRTSLGRAGRGTTAALVIASNAPDIDFVSTLRGGASTYMHWHRGPTHGPLGILGLGFATAGLVWLGRGWLDRRRRAPSAERDNATFGMLVGISMIAIALHILMDLPTSYGTRVLSPFDWHWYALDWMPIVDIYVLIVLGAGLLFGLRSEAAGRRNVAIALTLIAANYGVRAVSHHQALQLAPRLFGPTLPAKCANAPDTSGILDRWPHDGADRAAGFARPDGRRCLVELAALPTFLSPFDWRIVAEMSNAYEIHEVNVLDSRFREAAAAGEVFWRQSIRYPNIWTPPVARAAATPTAQIFLGFSRFPAVRVITDDRGVSTVRFSDIRFAAGLVALEQPVRRAVPFSLLVRLDASGRVIEQSLSP